MHGYRAAPVAVPAAPGMPKVTSMAPTSPTEVSKVAVAKRYALARPHGPIL